MSKFYIGFVVSNLIKLIFIDERLTNHVFFEPGFLKVGCQRWFFLGREKRIVNLSLPPCGGGPDKRIVKYWGVTPVGVTLFSYHGIFGEKNKYLPMPRKKVLGFP